MNLEGCERVRRDEQIFTSRILPQLESLRCGDRAIKNVQRMQLGKPVSVW